MRADTDKRRDSINARGAGAACCCCTVIDVFRAVRSAPSVDTHTDVTTNQVAAGASILTSVWLQATLIHVFCAVLTCEHYKNKIILMNHGYVADVSSLEKVQLWTHSYFLLTAYSVISIPFISLPVLYQEPW